MRFLSNLKGQGLVEYALILVLVAVVVIVVLSLLGPAIGNVFSIMVRALEASSEDQPPECYGSLLLPIMIGGMGTVVTISYWLSKNETEEQNSAALGG